ncbi:MAG: hypothetical protein U0V73_05485 [Acidimicrobiia bacterium]
MSADAANGGSRKLPTTIPSGSNRRLRLRASCWRRSACSGSSRRASHAARAHDRRPAGVRSASPHSSASFSGLATRVRARTLLYERRAAAKAASITGSSSSARPIRTHSRAVHTSTSSTPAIQCAHVRAPSKAHSPERSSALARCTTRRCQSTHDRLAATSCSRSPVGAAARWAPDERAE